MSGAACRTESGPSEAEPACDCLFCGAPGLESALRCASCTRELPFCCASGKRMALGDWSECPSEPGRRFDVGHGEQGWPAAAVDATGCRRGLVHSVSSVLPDFAAVYLPVCPSTPRQSPTRTGCHFPCRGRDMTRVASQEHACPLCEAALGPHDIKRIFDPISALRRTVFAGLLKGSSRERDGC